MSVEFEGVYLGDKITKIVKIGNRFAKEESDLDYFQKELRIRRNVVFNYFGTPGKDSNIRRYARKYVPELLLDGVENFTGEFYILDQELFGRTINSLFSDVPFSFVSDGFIFANFIEPKTKFRIPVRNSDDLDYFLFHYQNLRDKLSGQYDIFRDFYNLFRIFDPNPEIDSDILDSKLTFDELAHTNRNGDFSGVRRVSTISEIYGSMLEYDRRVLDGFMSENRQRFRMLKGLERNLVKDLKERKNEVTEDFKKAIRAHVPEFLEAYYSRLVEIERNSKGKL